ncbi:MAG: hypothetical protein IPL47_11835 [Phyllobacteriaceae bacterium]|nr:hypothetical protein [Phyllobacteriaceae bacterium]
MTAFSTSAIAAIAAGLVAIAAVAPAEAARRNASASFAAAQPSGGKHAKPGDGCLGAPACNDFIAECIGDGHDFKVEESGPNGEPTYGHCVKRTD